MYLPIDHIDTIILKYPPHTNSFSFFGLLFKESSRDNLFPDSLTTFTILHHVLRLPCDSSPRSDRSLLDASETTPSR